MALWQSSVFFKKDRNGLLFIFFLCLWITVQSRSVSEDEQKQSTFNTNVQARWSNDLGRIITKQISDYEINKNKEAFDSNVVIKNIIASVAKELKDVYEADEKTIGVYTGALEDLMEDGHDYINTQKIIESALGGKGNIMTLGKNLAELKEEPSVPLPTEDTGLNGLVLTGEKIDCTKLEIDDLPEDRNMCFSDLIRYSNYMTGSGTTFGGFMADLPQDIVDLTTGTMEGMSFKYNRLEYKLSQNNGDLAELRKHNRDLMINYNIEPEVYLHLKRSNAKNLKDLIVTESFDNIKFLEGISDEQKLLQQSVITQNKISQHRSRFSSKTLAGTVLRKVGTGIETTTTAFAFAQGGVDVVAGQDMIKLAEDLKINGLTEGEYSEMMRNGRLRVAQGSFGIATGIKNLGTFIGRRVEKTLAEKAKVANVKLLTGLQRFGPMVGSTISVGSSVVSMTKNAIAAKDAKYTGKKIIYGFMAAIDGVCAILDVVSLVTDVVFPPISPIIDLVSTILQVVNTILGFFADMVDLRTTHERVEEEFTKYISSDGFECYLTSMEKYYKDEGFDLFIFYIDAEVTGIVGDRDTLQAEKKRIVKCLTDKAKADIDDPMLRIALYDSTCSGKELKGRNNDDLIMAGFGPDRIYGERGDDILYGRGGSDTIYGGPGNDYMNGGTGRDYLFGQQGDDSVGCEPGIDFECSGGEGYDTLALAGESLIFDSSLWKGHYMTMGTEAEPSPISGVYLDLSYPSGNGGRNGINLGSCFPGWPQGFNSIVHCAAFKEETGLQRSLKSFMTSKNPTELSNLQEIENKMLWYLASDTTSKYFCDGASLYLVDTESGTVKIAKNVIKDLNEQEQEEAVVEEGRIKYKNNQLKALLVFAFKRSVSLNTFEKYVSRVPKNQKILTNYIPTTIIGNDENNIIDVSYGFHDMVYTGDGNNIISIGTTLNMFYEDDAAAAHESTSQHSGCCRTWFKYIVGGDGDNTLVIQSMRPPTDQSVGSGDYFGKWNLRNIDIKAELDSDEIKYSHVVYLQKIQTVEIHANTGLDYAITININANHFNGARRYILNLKVSDVHSASFHLLGPTVNNHDVTILPKGLFFAHSSNNIHLNEGKPHTISFQFYEDETHDIKTIHIHKEEGKVISSSGRSASLKHIMNVIGFSSCEGIYGNDEANLLMAVGGETTIHAFGGDDTLISARGKNVLIGGPGADTYVLHGPDVVDYLTVTVVMGDDNEITCKTTIYGEWNSEEGRLYIDILKHDHSEVVLNTVEIVPVEDGGENNQGTIQKDSTNRKLIFEPGNNFDNLKRNKAKIMRIKFTTTGSMATVKEKDKANELRFESITALAELTASVNEHGLVFKDKSDRTVLVDHEWVFKLNTRILTNVNDLITDFTERFPTMLFRKETGNEFLRATSSDIVTFLYDQLESLETQLGQDYDTILDSTTLENEGDEINLGNGENIILAKTKGKTYILGERASGSIIIAKDFTEGSGEVTIKGGRDHQNLNMVVVDAESDAEVTVVNMGQYDVIVIGGLPNEIGAYSDKEYMTHLSKENQNFILLGTFPRRIIFKKGSETSVVFDVMTYISKRKRNEPYVGITVSYGENRLLRLNCPFSKEQARINIYGKTKEQTQVYFSQKDMEAENYRHHYLTIPGNIVDKEIPAFIVARAIRYQFKDGIKFSDGLLAKDQLCAFIKEKLNSYDGYELLSLSGVSLINTEFAC